MKANLAPPSASAPGPADKVDQGHGTLNFKFCLVEFGYLMFTRRHRILGLATNVGVKWAGCGMDFVRADDGQDTAPVNILEIPTPQSSRHDISSPTTQTAAELRLSYQTAGKVNGESSEAAPTLPKICPPSPRYNPYPTEDKDESARSSDEPFTPDNKAS